MLNCMYYDAIMGYYNLFIVNLLLIYGIKLYILMIYIKKENPSMKGFLLLIYL